MKNKLIYNDLNKLFNRTAAIPISNKDKFVIFSDFHMGNGGMRDDFAKNAGLFRNVLKNYYLKKKFHLILNGDVEELYRFSYNKVRSRWDDIYQLFNTFKKRNAFFKITGNHDYILNLKKYLNRGEKILQAVKLDYSGNIIFIFHGHQASGFLTRYNPFFVFLLRYIANPLRIKNWEVSYNSRKKIKTEKNVYDFSIDKKIISIIGHTHRPLFLSLSKIDLLRFKIEQLCRQYETESKKKKNKIESAVNIYKEELLYYYNKKHKKEGQQTSLYNSNLFVPSLFNSGCVIGKRGITAIEISGGKISLTHWFDKNKKAKYLKYNKPAPERLNKTSYYRMNFNEESLNYIFTRIKLLA